MAKPTKISVSFSKLTPLKQYENIKLDASIEMTLEDGDNVGDVYKEAYKMVMKEVLEKTEFLKKNLGDKKGN